jgi:hypothetical protein
MAPEKTTLIDSITIPLGRRSSENAPEIVQLCCPPSGGSVGTSFTALASVDGVNDTALTSCYLSLPGQPDKQADSIAMVSATQWSASFSGVQPANGYTLTAVGNDLPIHGRDSATNINVVANGATACICVEVTIKTGVSGSKSMVEAIKFTGRFPVEDYGRPKPLSLSGRLPIAFVIGGPIAPLHQITNCTLGNLVPEEIKREGNRWSAPFSRVPAGEYTLQVMADDGTTDSHRIIISAAQVP